MKYNDMQAAVANLKPHPRRYAYPLKNTNRGGVADDPQLGYGDFSAVAQVALAQAKLSETLTDAQKQDWLIKNKSDGDQMSAAVQGAVYRRVYHDVLPLTWAPEFFEEANLANDEWPALDLRERETEYEAKTIGPDGGAPTSRKVGRRADLTLFLEYLRTERVRYRLIDINTGDVPAMEDIIKDLELSWSVQKHNMALKLIQASALASGMNAMPYMRLHPAIVAASATANIPSTNTYNFTSLSLPNPGKITVEKLKRIFQHVALLQSSTIDQETPIRLKTLYISPQNKRDFWDMADLVGTYGSSVAGIILDGTDITKPKDVLPTAVKDAIFKNGDLRQFYGEDFELRMSNLIPAGYWYASMNLPLGVWFWKPGMKIVSKKDDGEAMSKNEGEIGFGTPQLAMIPTQWQYRCLQGQW